MPEYTNKLINETSPYLLQHAHNPVDWYPWGDEAFRLARQLGKPVFLSIGYSSCHWCHVMEKESFENIEIAALMNEHFVNIKVDREERPDIDQVYMQFVQMTTGSGGWPMSVFLTSDQIPFYGGTYFPPVDGFGRPGFKRVLLALSDYYQKEKEKLQKSLAEFEQVYLNEPGEKSASNQLPDSSDWDIALQTLKNYYEPQYGGIGQAPKFPAVVVFNLFLRHHKNTTDNNFLNMTEHTLRCMANGGIYDQIGGGFARYSVDEKWLVPHFEKMLYDNGQLVCLYLDTYLVKKDNYFLKIAEETLAFISGEMTSDDGGFYSSLDADSEGHEGKYYVWNIQEIYDLLDKETADLICAHYGVTIAGNIEGTNILNVVAQPDDLASQFNLSEKQVLNKIKSAKQVLLQHRSKRIRPGLDDKIIASWNGLMLSAFCKAFQVTQNPEYAEVISKNVDFMTNNLYSQGKLKRSCKDGQAKYDAFIEDYAFVIQALLDAFEALFDPNFITLAIELNNYANAHFWDKVNGGYYTTSDEQEKLIKRMKDATDSSIPAGTGIMLLNNLRLFSYTENKKYYTLAEDILKKYSTELSENPYGYASYLAGLDFYLEKPKEIVIAKKTDQNIDDYLQLIFGQYNPNKIVMVLDEGKDNSILTATLIDAKQPIDGKVTSYVCHNFSCSLPVFSIKDLEELLKSG